MKLFLGVGVSFAAADWKATDPTLEDIKAATKIKNLAAKGSLADKLINAGKNNELKNVEIFIANGADFEARNNDDMTPLMIAAKEGYYDIVNILINAGANPNAGDKFNRTPLFMATEKDHVDIVRILMAAGASDRDFESIFVSAVYKGNAEMVKALIVGNVNINDETLDTAYMIALNKRNTELVNIIKHLRLQCSSSKIVD